MSERPDEEDATGDQPQLLKLNSKKLKSSTSLDSKVEKVECKICGETVLPGEFKSHKLTTKHKIAQEKIKNELQTTHFECSKCKEKIPRVYWKKHKQTEKHKSAIQQNQVQQSRQVSEKTVIEKTYEFREGSLENSQYIDVLATYLAVRHAFNSKEDFYISINNSDWDDYGDIVLEIISAKKMVVNAIRCKKIETKKNYTTIVLSSQSGNLSLKDQFEIIQKLKTKKNKNKVNFKLLTVASVTINKNRKFIYDDEVFEIWPKFDEKNFWENINLLVDFWQEIDLKIFKETMEALKCSKNFHEIVTQEKLNFKGFKASKEILAVWEQIDEDKFVKLKEFFLSLNATNFRDFYFKPDKFEQLKENVDSWKIFTRQNLQQMKEIIQAWCNIKIKEKTIKKINYNIQDFDKTKNTFEFWQKIQDKFENFCQKIKDFQYWLQLEKEKQFWINKEVEIKQFPSKKKDLFNTTNDFEDVCTFKILNDSENSINSIFENYSMYINQKTSLELHSGITSFIDEKFGYSKHFASDLIKFVKKEFKTDTNIKIKESHYKLTKQEVLLKIAELLLGQFMVLPNCIVSKRDTKLWSKIIREFDVVIMSPEADLVEKLYSGINWILEKSTETIEKNKTGKIRKSHKINTTNKIHTTDKIDTIDKIDTTDKIETTEKIDTTDKIDTIDKIHETIIYSLDDSNNLKVDVEKIQDETVKSFFFAQDGTLRYLYLALWKTGLAPLILHVKNEKQLELISNVINFLKTENLIVNFIVITDISTNGFFTDSMNIFRSVDDLILNCIELLEEVLKQNIKILDFDKTLKDLYQINDHLLMRLTPNALLNIFLEDYFFVDTVVKMSKDIVDDTIVLDQETIQKIQLYFSKNEEKKEKKELLYLINSNGAPINVKVPPEL